MIKAIHFKKHPPVGDEVVPVSLRLNYMQVTRTNEIHFSDVEHVVAALREVIPSADPHVVIDCGVISLHYTTTINETLLKTMLAKGWSAR